MGQGFSQCKDEGAAPESSSPRGQRQAWTAELPRSLPGDIKSSRGEWTQSWENQLDTEKRAPAGEVPYPLPGVMLGSIMETPRHQHPMYIAHSDMVRSTLGVQGVSEEKG